MWTKTKARDTAAEPEVITVSFPPLSHAYIWRKMHKIRAAKQAAKDQGRPFEAEADLQILSLHYGCTKKKDLELSPEELSEAVGFIQAALNDMHYDLKAKLINTAFISEVHKTSSGDCRLVTQFTLKVK